MHQEAKKKREGVETGGDTLNSRKQAHRAMPVWSAAPLRAGQARNPQVGAWGGSDLVVCNSAGAIGQVSQASNWEPGAHRHPPPTLFPGFSFLTALIDWERVPLNE